MDNDLIYKIETDLAKFDFEYLHAALQKSYWAQLRSFEDNSTAFKNSRAFMLFNQHGKVLGFARVVTDYVAFAYLADVYIDENQRGQGLGKYLVSHILADPKLAKVKRFMLRTKDAHDLYTKFGFTPLKDPQLLMEKLHLSN